MAELSACYYGSCVSCEEQIEPGQPVVYDGPRLIHAHHKTQCRLVHPEGSGHP